MRKIDCPVCGDAMSKRGLSGHLGSHKKDPLKEALCELLKADDGQKNTLCQDKETPEVERIARKAKRKKEQTRAKSRKTIRQIERKAAETITQ